MLCSAPKSSEIRPFQSRVRMPTAKKDKVIRIGDDFRRECFRAPCQPPVLQEPVHVQVDMELAVLSANGLHRREIGRSVRRPIRNSVRHGE